MELLEEVDCPRTADNIQVEQVLHMNGGEGEYSYAENALVQKKAISKAKTLIQESIEEIYCSNFPECFIIADLGCSSGPNAYLPTWNVIEVLHSTCHRLNRKPPMLQVFLNDLPGNDFNSTFKLLPSFYERLKREKGEEFGQCFISAVPGSFYGRLFPSHSLHFAFSSYAVHWLSQVPKGLVSESGIQLNKENVYIAKTSPPSVHRAYLDQFESDFTRFLKLRSEELKPGGCIVLTLLGNDNHYPSLWELFGMVIKDMVSEGLIEKSKLESFNVPFYAPTAEEIGIIIQREGSFNIHRLEAFQQSWFVNFDDDNKAALDNLAGAKQVAKRLRSIGESLVGTHFGNGAILDDMYQRFSIKVTEYLEIGLGFITNLLISLTEN